MDKKLSEISLTSQERMAELIAEAEKELNKILPEIKKLEKSIDRLEELKKQQFKLTSLIISLKSVNESKYIYQKKYNENDDYTDYDNVTQHVNNDTTKRKLFLPDEAFSKVKKLIRPKNNLNYEIFKSVVFNSGVCSTEQIKQYLVENNIKQPKTGKTFEAVELKEISSRANYLVRKGILIVATPGFFRSVFGWKEIN